MEIIPLSTLGPSPAALTRRDTATLPALGNNTSLTVAPIETPAVQVVLRQEPVPAPVYTESSTSVYRLRDESAAGPARQATAQALLSSLNNSSQKKSPFSVSSVFSQIPALSRETSEYRNEARQFKVPAKMRAENLNPDFSTTKGAKAEGVSLNIRTKDGDTVLIQMNRIRYPDGSDGVEFSFVVDGSLSEREQEAVLANTGLSPQGSEAAFVSGLPDFTATFRSPVIHNRQNYTQVSAMVLTLSQETTREAHETGRLIKQESHYALSSSRFEPLPGLEYPDVVSGNYQYVKEKTEATTSRILSLSGDRVADVWTAQDMETTTQRQRFESYQLTDEDHHQDSQRQLDSLALQLEALYRHKQGVAIEALLALRPERLFVGL